MDTIFSKWMAEGLLLLHSNIIKGNINSAIHCAYDSSLKSNLAPIGDLVLHGHCGLGSVFHRQDVLFVGHGRSGEDHTQQV